MEKRVGSKEFKTEAEYTKWQIGDLAKSIIHLTVLDDGTIRVSYFYWVP